MELLRVATRRRFYLGVDTARSALRIQEEFGALVVVVVSSHNEKEGKLERLTCLPSSGNVDHGLI